jgi:CRP/FNR family transcriptional regulator, cyclic AMP receptor protein
MGRLKRERTYLIVPKGMDIKVPSDLLGITQLRYSLGDPADIVSRLNPVCAEMKERVRALGPR